jgi:hypothetical protein
MSDQTSSLICDIFILNVSCVFEQQKFSERSTDSYADESQKDRWVNCGSDDDVVDRDYCITY